MYNRYNDLTKISQLVKLFKNNVTNYVFKIVHIDVSLSYLLLFIHNSCSAAILMHPFFLCDVSLLYYVYCI